MRAQPPSDSRGPRGASTSERSAGVVAFREVPATDASPARRLFLLLDYGRHWDYPKGHLEPGESDRDAARRELREETGIAHVELVEGFSHEIGYCFRSSRKGLVRKTVIFFAGRVASPEVCLSHEHVGYAWLEREAALAQLTFDNARAVLAAAADFLDGRTPSPAPRSPPSLFDEA